MRTALRKKHFFVSKDAQICAHKRGRSSATPGKTVGKTGSRRPFRRIFLCSTFGDVLFSKSKKKAERPGG